MKGLASMFGSPISGLKIFEAFTTRACWKPLCKWFWAPLAFLLVVGCDIKSETDIYLVDLFEVIETGIGIETSSQLIVEISSSSECEETTTKLLPMLQGTFGDGVTGKGCHDEGMSSYIAFGLTVPILLESSRNEVDSTLAIVLSQHGDWYGTEMSVNVLRMDNLARLISDEFFQTVDFSTAKVGLNISNDLRQSAEIRIRGAFVNGEPVQEYIDFTLDRRGELDVLLSNVGSAMAFDKGKAKLFLFRMI